ncbi:MAG: hypothetical protein RSG57_04020 [Christensenellaceae bacterium]
MAENKGKGNKTLLVILIIAVIAVLIVLLYIGVIKPAMEPKQSPEQVAAEELIKEKNAELGIIPGMTNEEIQERLNQVVTDSMLNISINSVPYFQNGQSEGNLRLENVQGNKYSFVVEIVRDDTGERIYKSGLIDPGYFVENAKLDVELAKGKYPCVATFTAYDGIEQIGTVGAQIVITVAE